jgi:hypothetical protein
MIKIKVPAKKISDIQIQYSVIERDYFPLKPISYYLAPEFDGVKINRVILNGKSFPDNHPVDMAKPCDTDVFDHVVLRDGDELIVIPAIDFFVAGLATLSLFGSVIATGSTTVMAALAIVGNLAVAMIVSTAMSMLLAPGKPKGQGASNSASTVGWDGYNNKFGPGGMIPRVFGVHKSDCTVVYYAVEEEYVYGANKKVDLSKTKSFVKMIGDFGWGEATSVTGVKLNENPIANFGSDTIVTIRLGTTDQTAIDGFAENKVTRQVGVEIPLTMTAADIKGEWAYLSQYVIPTGEGLYIYECTTKGICIGNEPTWNQTVGLANGTTWGTAKFTCRLDNRYIYTTPEGEGNYITGFQAHFECPGGLYASGPTGQAPNEIKVKIEHRVYTPGGTEEWTDDGTDIVAANKTSVCRWSKRVDGLTLNRYDIRYTKTWVKIRVDGTTAGDYSSVHTLQLSKVTEIKPQTVVPTYAGRILVAVVALATSSISGGCPTMTAVVDNKSPVWHPETSTWVQESTDNPLYHVRHTLTDTTWGFGRWVTESQIDDDMLLACAEYCQPTGGDKKHTSNFVWNQRRKLKPMMQDILGPARILMFEAAGKFRFVAEEAKSATQLFTKANIRPGSLKVEWFDERLNFNAYNMSFVSKDQDYKPYPVMIARDETPVKPKSLSLFGVVDGDEACRDTKYQLNILDMHQLITFEAGTDAILVLPGDVFAFAHQIPKVKTGALTSGRASEDSLYANQITLDEEVILEAGKTYQITVQFKQGVNVDVVETKTVANEAGTYQTLTVTEGFSQAIKRFDTYALGEFGTVTREYRVLDREDKTDENYTVLKAIEYLASTFSDELTLEEVVGESVTNNNLPPGPILTVDGSEEIKFLENGEKVVNLNVHWPAPEPASGYGEYLGADLYYAMPDIETVIAEFATTENWVAGNGSVADNTTFGQYKKDSSKKITSASGGYGDAVYTFASPLDLSPTNNAWVAVRFYIENISNFDPDDPCVKFYLRTDASNYFYVERYREELVNGWNCILVEKGEMDEVGTGNWASIASAKIEIKADTALVAVASFDNSYYYQDFAWIFVDTVNGTSFNWPNVMLDTAILFAAYSFGPTGVQQPVPGYGAEYITGVASGTLAPDLTYLDFWGTAGANQILLEWEYQEGYSAEADLAKWKLYRAVVYAAQVFAQSLIHFDGSDGSNSFLDESGKVWTAHGDDGVLPELDETEKVFGTCSGLFTRAKNTYIDTPEHADFAFGIGDFTVDLRMMLGALPTGAEKYTLLHKKSTSPSTNEIWLYVMAGAVGWDVKLEITLDGVAYTTVVGSIGAMQVRSPTGDYQTGSWARFPASGSFYTCVDEYPDVDDADFIYCGAGSNQCVFYFDAPTLPTGSSNISVQIMTRVQHSNTALQFKAGMMIGGVWYYGPNKNYTAAYTDVTTTWDTNPATGLPWTAEQVNAIQSFGIFNITAGGNYYCSKIYMKIIWDPSGWHHIEMEGYFDSLEIYIDGAPTGSPVDISNGMPHCGGVLRVGSDVDGANSLDGWVDELRLLKGTAAHGEAFTPPTEAYTYIPAGDPEAPLFADAVLVHESASKNERAWTDTDVELLAYYYYWLAAVNGADQESDPLGDVENIPYGIGPLSPTGTLADENAPYWPSGTEITLVVTPNDMGTMGDWGASWNNAAVDLEGNFDGYRIRIYRKSSLVGTFNLLATYFADSSATSFDGSTILLQIGSVTYSYYVTVEPFDKSRNYGQVLASAENVTNDTTAPSVPTGLNVLVNALVLAASVTANTDDPDWAGNEFHFSQTSGFTPSAGTLKWRGDANTYNYNAPAAGIWYCRVKAYDMSGNLSAGCEQVAATTSTGGETGETGTPFPMTGLGSTYKTRSGIGTVTFTVPAGKVGILGSYHLAGGASDFTTLKIIDGASEFLFESTSADTTSITRALPNTSQIYLQAGMVVELEVTDAGGSGNFRVWTITADPQYTVVVKELTDAGGGGQLAYTVPEHKKLVACYVWASDYSASIFLEVYDQINTIWEPLIDGSIGPIGTKHLVVFGPGTILSASDATESLFMIGYLKAGEAEGIEVDSIPLTQPLPALYGYGFEKHYTGEKLIPKSGTVWFKIDPSLVSETPTRIRVKIINYDAYETNLNGTMYSVDRATGVKTDVWTIVAGQLTKYVDPYDSDNYYLVELTEDGTEDQLVSIWWEVY